MRIEIITWLDSAQSSSTAWKFLSDMEEYSLNPCIITSTGVVLEEDEESLIIAGHVYQIADDDIGFCGEMCIPKSCIQKRKVITNTTSKE